MKKEFSSVSTSWEWGYPDLPAPRPTAWLYRRPGTAHLHQQPLKPLVRRMTQDLHKGSLARLAPEERRYQCRVHLARFA